ncbi:hypothetical protein QQ045_023871 [Rhodiola kirilowii]
MEISQGTPVFHALLECGEHVCHSKHSSGKHGEVYWNQKFKFDFSAIDLTQLKHLKIRIMNNRILRASKFVGKTIVHIGGIVEEGTTRGILEVKPTVYNVVLEDDTYRGEIKLGIKFIMNTEEAEGTSKPMYPTEESRPLWLTIKKLLFRFFPNRTIYQNKA